MLANIRIVVTGALRRLDGGRPAFPHLTREADEAVALAGGVAAAILGALVVWMSAAPLTSAVTVEGMAVAADLRKVVQHPTGGLIAEMLVSEGDSVREGTPLIRLDPTAAKARWEDARAQWITAELRHARLQAEQAGRAELAVPAHLPHQVPATQLAPLVERERAVLATRRAQQTLRRTTLHNEIAELRARIQGLEAERASKGHQATLLERELEGKTHLHQRGYASLTSVLELERARAGLIGDRDKAAAQLRETRETIIGKELALRRLDADDEAALAEEMTQVAAGLDALRAAMGDADLGVRLTTIAAPAAGRVIGLTVRNPGAVIGPGEVLMEIVPEDSHLVLEGGTGPADGPLVAPGAPVRVRFLSDPAWEAPLLPGRVSYISDDVMPNGPFEGQFKVQVTLEAAREARPGAPVVMFVETALHTPLSYLASPLIELVQRSMREQ